MVIGKVTEYGQNVTLFYYAPKCCRVDAGWYLRTTLDTPFIYIKIQIPNQKYDGKL